MLFLSCFVRLRLYFGQRTLSTPPSISTRLSRMIKKLLHFFGFIIVWFEEYLTLIYFWISKWLVFNANHSSFCFYRVPFVDYFKSPKAFKTSLRKTHKLLSRARPNRTTKALDPPNHSSGVYSTHEKCRG